MKINSLHDAFLNGSLMTGAELAVKEGVDLSSESIKSDQAFETYWSFERLRGGIVELNGTSFASGISMATQLLVECQKEKSPTAWVFSGNGGIYPKDLQSAGVDLNAHAFIKLQDDLSILKVTSNLLKSLAFGMVVVELETPFSLKQSNQQLLANLAKKGDVLLLHLQNRRYSTDFDSSKKEQISFGSSATTRVNARLHYQNYNQFICQLDVQKSKYMSAHTRFQERLCGIVGLR